MKKYFFLFAFLGLFAFTASAQKKACCAKGGEKTGMTCTASEKAAMDKAAAADESIVRQVSNTGDETFVRKEVCPMTGKVSYTDVEYCTKSSKFVNVSPSENKAECTKKASATKTSATKVSSTTKKACCAGGEKSCSKKGEKASTEKAATNEAKVKLVSGEGQ